MTTAGSASARASPYAVAFDATATVIQRRAANYRRLAGAIVAVGFLAPAGAVAWHSWRPLALWALVVPCCAVGLAVDTRLVAAWRRDVLAARAAGEIDLDIFRTAIASNRALPAGTLEGMLATLPGGATAPRPAAQR